MNADDLKIEVEVTMKTGDLEQLIDEIAQLRGDRAEFYSVLAEAVEDGVHHRGCQTSSGLEVDKGLPCNCWLTRASAAVARVEGRTP